MRETGAVREALTGGKASENADCREAQVVWRFRLTIDSLWMGFVIPVSLFVGF